MAYEGTGRETIKIEPGMILFGDVGATMQLPRFYKVLGLTPSGKSARIRRLDHVERADDGHGFTGTAVPIDGAFVGEVATCRIKVADWGFGDAHEYVVRSGHAFRPWDGRPCHFDHLD